MMVTSLKVGDTVKIHPACNWFMQGVKYGEVTKIGNKYVHVKAIGFNSTRKFSDTTLLEKIH
jgi:hypothetical protein